MKDHQPMTIDVKAMLDRTRPLAERARQIELRRRERAYHDGYADGYEAARRRFAPKEQPRDE